MKILRRTRILVATALITAGSLHAAPGMRRPAVMKDALLTVTVSDLHGMLDGLGTAATKVSPMMNPLMIKSMLGMQLGDPNLASFAPGTGLAIVMLDPATIFGVLELPEAGAGIYAKKLASQGMKTRYTQGVLLAAKTPAVLDRAANAIPTVKRQLLAKRAPMIRLGVEPANYLSQHSSDVDALIASIPKTMGNAMQAQAQGQPTAAAAGVTAILEAEVRVLRSLLEQVAAMEIAIGASAKGVHIDSTLEAVQASRLSRFLNAPRTQDWNPNVQRAGNRGAFMLEFLVENPEALARFTAQELGHLAMVMKLEEKQIRPIMNYMQKCMATFGGSVYESIFSTGVPGFSFDYIMEVSDEKAALDLFRKMPSDLETTGFLKLYEDFGMPMSFDFKENARTYKGVKIHTFTTRIGMDHLPDEQRKQMDAMNLSNMEYEMAILDGICAYTMGGERRIDAIIDTLRKPGATPTPLASRTLLPAGGFYYGDFDVAGYLDFITSMVPAMPNDGMATMKQIRTMLTGASPIASAGHKQGDLVQYSTLIPGDLLARIGQAAMAMQMQKMQKQGAGGQTAPVILPPAP